MSAVQGQQGAGAGWILDLDNNVSIHVLEGQWALIGRNSERTVKTYISVYSAGGELRLSL